MLCIISKMQSMILQHKTWDKACATVFAKTLGIFSDYALWAVLLLFQDENLYFYFSDIEKLSMAVFPTFSLYSRIFLFDENFCVHFMDFAILLEGVKKLLYCSYNPRNDGRETIHSLHTNPDI